MSRSEEEAAFPGKKSPDSPDHVETNVPVESAFHPVSAEDPETYLKRILQQRIRMELTDPDNPEILRLALIYHLGIRRGKITEDELQEAKDNMAELDAGILGDIANASGPYVFAKFVRDQNRLIVGNPRLNHVDFALAAGMELPVDAGKLRPKGSGILVFGISDSLGFVKMPIQRAETGNLIQRLRPEIPITLSDR